VLLIGLSYVRITLLIVQDDVKSLRQLCCVKGTAHDEVVDIDDNYYYNGNSFQHLTHPYE